MIFFVYISGVDGDNPSLTMPADGEGLDCEYENCRRMHALRLRMLDRLVSYMTELKSVGGVRAIPYLQVRSFFDVYLC